MFPFVRTGDAGAPRATAGSAPVGLAQSAPGLRRAAERMLVALVKNLQTMAGQTTSVEGSVAAIGAEAMRDLVAGYRPEHVAATILCDRPSCTILALLDSTLVYSIIELLAGGGGAEPVPDMPRAATAIDGQYAHTLVTLAAVALEAEWNANGLGQTRAARLDGAFALDACGARVQMVGVVTFTVSLFGLRGIFKLVLPPAVLDLFREDDGEIEPEPVLTSDPDWRERFASELGRAPVTVEAFLAVQDLSLGAIALLKPGQVLKVPTGAHSRATLVCDGRVLYRGELGQDKDRYALRLEDAVAALALRSSPDLPSRSRRSQTAPRNT